MEGAQVVPGLYTAGWIKRGPSGIIGTNKADSDETVRHILEDIPRLTPCARRETRELLESLNKKGARVISFQDWKKIDAQEISRGQAAGKPREKFVTVPEMFAALNA